MEVSFRNMDPSPALESFAHRQAAKLTNICDRIERCEVVIERPHQHQHVHARVTVVVPDLDAVVSDNNSPEDAYDDAYDDAYFTVRDAFRAARRKLVARVQRRYRCDREKLLST